MLDVPVPDPHPGPVQALLAEVRARAGSERGSAALAADLAIRDRSHAMRAVLSEGAEGPAPAPWWAALGRVAHAQADAAAGVRAAARHFDQAFEADPSLRLSRADAMAYAQVLWDLGRRDEVERIPVAARALEWREGDLFALAGIAHRLGVESPEWIERANAVLLAPYGLAAIGIEPGEADPFDRVVTDAAPSSAGGPLITVVMTTFQRGATLLTAVRSVIAQTWRDWELIVVDDCSGEQYHALLDQVESLDGRIRVIRREDNRGTYAGRNLALAQARGDYVTFQDDDDWSHPERLERQVAALLADGQKVICLSYALHVTEQLDIRFGGRRTRVLGSSTMMLRTGTLVAVGGFDQVRKGGDTELIRRIEAVAPEGRVTLPEPLALMRLTDNSLSRADFQPGWVHPARAEYAEASMAWHRTLRPGDADAARITAPRPFPVPDHILGTRSQEPRRFDVVIAGDFSEEFVYASAAAAALRHALRSGAQVGLLQCDTPGRGDAAERSSIAGDVRAMIDGDRVHRITTGELARARTVVITAPELLQFASPDAWPVAADEVVLVVDSPSAEHDPESRWSAEDCRAALARLVEDVSRLRLAAADPSIAARLRAAWPEAQVVVLDEGEPVLLRPIAPRPAAAVTVVGAVDSTCARDWKGADAALTRELSAHRDLDVRVLRGSMPARRTDRVLPDGWMELRPGSTPVPLFLQQLDVLVVPPSQTLTPGQRRLIALAVAHGRVVMSAGPAPEPLADVMVACSTGTLADEVRALTADAGAFSRQSRGARAAIAAGPSAAAVSWRHLMRLGD